MFRILIVDDDQPLLIRLRDHIRQQIIGSVIDLAGTVEDANQAIERTLSAGEAYDCAILDFQLPTSDGDLKVDESVCDRLRREMRKTGIVHITTAADSSEIRLHDRKYHGSPNLLAAALISKRTIVFFTNTIEVVRTFLYSKFIQAKFEELFAPKHAMEADASVTSALQSFERWLILMWDGLSEDTKELIQTRFTVDSKNTPLRVELKALAELMSKSRPVKSTAHFTFYVQDSISTRAGLTGEKLAERYAGSLERMIAYLRKPPFLRSAPPLATIPVYLLKAGKIFPGFRGPFYDFNRDGPFLALPDEIGLSVTAEREAVINIIRELTRVFNGFDRHPRDPQTRPWTWFDAAFSKAVGNLTLPEETESFQSQLPIGRCFEATDSEQYSWAFFNFLVKQLGWSKLNDLWLRGAREPHRTPIEILDQELNGDLDYHLARFHQQLYLKGLLRFMGGEGSGHEEVFHIRADQIIRHQERLDHCGYRWYRIRLEQDLEWLELSLQPLSGSMSLVGYVGIVSSDEQDYHSLLRFESRENYELVARLTNVDHKRHVALIISNVGLKGVHDTDSYQHADRQFYQLTVYGAKSAARASSPAPVLP